MIRIGIHIFTISNYLNTTCSNKCPPSFPHLSTQQKLHTSPQELQAVRQRGNAKWDYLDMSCLLPSSSSQPRMLSVAKQDLNENRWPREETTARIKERSEMGTSFTDSKLKSRVCSEASRKLDKLEFPSSAKKCKEKFPNTMKDGEEHQKSEALLTEHEMMEGVAHAVESRKKRKRASCFSTMASIQRMAKQLLEQQQVLHSRFLESIEQQVREVMLREEAVRKQEAARLRKEQELWAQEVVIAASRNAAIVELLQKLIGQTVNSKAIASKDLREDLTKESTRWPKVEIHALIRLRSGTETRFQEAGGPKAQLWKEISWSMECMGYNRSAKRCKEKWENINKYFKKMKDSSHEYPNAKTCPYFHTLRTLYETGILGSTSSKCNKLEDNAAPVYPPLTPTRSSSKPSLLQLSRNCEQTNAANTELNAQKTTLNSGLPHSVLSCHDVDARKREAGEESLCSNNSSKVETCFSLGKDIEELQQRENEKEEETEKLQQQQHVHVTEGLRLNAYSNNSKYGYLSQNLGT